MALESVRKSDPELFGFMKSELQRQREGLEMIPSENFASLAVLEACGSVLNNKYAEGYPGRRYYGGNQHIDMVESLAISRAKSLFRVPYANVQPYSGSPANLAVYMAVCRPGDTIMGMGLSDGGHLTHGSKTSASGILFNSVQYGLGENGLIDIDGASRLAKESRPKLIWIGATAYSRPLPFKEFAEMADSVGAYLAADISHVAGLVVGGVHDSPVEHVHIVTTTTHKTLRGPRGAIIMVTDKGVRKDAELPNKVDKMVFPGLQGGPHEHQIAGIAAALLEASRPEFRTYAAQVVRNARALAGRLTKNGLKIVSNGTDNHMMLVDLTQFGKGKGVFVQYALDEAGITLNKNTIPNEPNNPFYPSGIRLGTPALTTRGMKEPEMERIADLITEVIMEVGDNELPDDRDERNECLRKYKESIKSNGKLKGIRKMVLDICSRFPLYPELSV